MSVADLTENERNEKGNSDENDYYQLEPLQENDISQKGSSMSKKVEHTELLVTVNGNKLTSSTSESPPVSPMSITESTNDISSPNTHDVDNLPESKLEDSLPDTEVPVKVVEQQIIHVPDSPGSEDKPGEILIKRTSSGKSPSKIPRYVGTKQKGTNGQISYYMSLKRNEESSSKGNSKAKFYIQIQNPCSAYMHLMPKFRRSNASSPLSSRAVSEASLLSVSERSRDSALSENSYLEPGDVVDLKISMKGTSDKLNKVDQESKEERPSEETNLSKATLTGSLLSLNSHLEPDTVINTLYETLKRFNDDDWPSDSGGLETTSVQECSCTEAASAMPETMTDCLSNENEDCSDSYTPPPLPSRFYAQEDTESSSSTLQQSKLDSELEKPVDEIQMSEGNTSFAMSNTGHQDLERTSSEVSLVSRPIRHHWDFGLWSDVTG